MPRGMGRFRRVIAALLALALLVLPGAPMRHASASRVHDHSLGQLASHDCAGHGAEAALDQALATHQDGPGQADRHSDKQPGLACCLSAQCPAMVAIPPLAPAQPAPMPRVRVMDFPLPLAPDGVGVDPALHPPRTPA
jgi:hypothetical protein